MAAKKKGFVSIFGILVLNVSLMFLTMMTNKLGTQSVRNESLAFAELFAIKKVKQDFFKSEISNTQISYDTYQIELGYDEAACIISLYEGSTLQFRSRLTYDIERKMVVVYEYIE